MARSRHRSEFQVVSTWSTRFRIAFGPTSPQPPSINSTGLQTRSNGAENDTQIDARRKIDARDRTKTQLDGLRTGDLGIHPRQRTHQGEDTGSTADPEIHSTSRQQEGIETPQIGGSSMKSLLPLVSGGAIVAVWRSLHPSVKVAAIVGASFLAGVELNKDFRSDLRGPSGGRRSENRRSCGHEKSDSGRPARDGECRHRRSTSSKPQGGRQAKDGLRRRG